jgi:hypothetical protein
MMQEELEKRVLSLPVRAAEIQVKDQATLSIANEFLLGIKALQKEIDSTFDPIIQAAHEAHKKALTQKKKFEDPLDQAERMVKPKIGAYLQEQDRIRREAEEAARRAEWERQRVEKEALEKAMKAEAEGKAKEAEKIIEKAAKAEILVPPPLIIPERQQTQGISMREVWRFEITDPKLLPREYLTPDLVRIGKVVQACKGETNIAGVRVFSEKIIAARGSYA